MLVNGKHFRSIWRDKSNGKIKIIDQTKLPHRFEILTIDTLHNAMLAIKDMKVRGAPLIGVTAAYGMAIAMQEDSSDYNLDYASNYLNSSRPTAVNLKWAIEKILKELSILKIAERSSIAMNLADQMAEEDVQTNKLIGINGAKIIQKLAEQKKDASPVRILTHCNAGWLATVDIGTATAPIYESHNKGIDIEVWVDETRPRNQGAALTTWELFHNGVKQKLIVDNAGGHLMQHGMVDVVIVGSDRTTGSGDVCNKIGTYLKALAAKDNKVPFYAALPLSTIDWNIENGISDIPIEERNVNEVTHVQGMNDKGDIISVLIAPKEVEAANPAFDVTPKELITGIITEKGILDRNNIKIFKEKNI